MKRVLVVFFLCLQVLQAAEPVQPVVTKQKDTLSIDYDDVQIRTIVLEVAKTCGIKVVVPDELKGYTSVRLRDVTWRQIYTVVLQPIEYDFVERNSVVEIGRKAEIDALPLDRNYVELFFQKPQTLAEHLKKRIHGRKVIVDEVRADGVVVVTHPRDTKRMLEWIAKVDTPWERLDPYPRKVYFPAKIPELPVPEVPGWMPQDHPDILTTHVILFSWVDAAEAKPIIERECANLNKVVLDVVSNALVITGTASQHRKVDVLAKYLDDKKWYMRPEKETGPTQSSE